MTVLSYYGFVLCSSDDKRSTLELFSQARKHLLVVARHEGLDQLADVCTEHLPLLRTMHAMGLKWIHKFFHEDAPLVFRLGYHSVGHQYIAMVGSNTHQKF